MRDRDIRSFILDSYLNPFKEDGQSRIVEELLLPIAGARIDVAVVNGHLHGYEIKSACDTMQRLPGQVQAYAKVFDYLTIVTEPKYCTAVLDIVPKWVGVSICEEGKRGISIKVKRKAKQNKTKEGFHVAKLLWNSELIDLLSQHNIPFNKKNRNWILCELLAHHLTIEQLSIDVRAILKKRKQWKEPKVGFPVVLCDGSV